MLIVPDSYITYTMEATDSSIPDGYMINYHTMQSDRTYDSSTLFYLKTNSLREQDRGKEFKARVNLWLAEKVQAVRANYPDLQIIITTTPGHSQISTSETFLVEVITEFLASNPTLNVIAQSLLRRHITVQMRSHDEQLHRDSIEVICPPEVTMSELNRGKIVFVLDDIYTSGATLRACADKVRETGATLVLTLAIGKTVSN